MAYAFRGTPVSLSDVAAATARPIMVSILLGLAAAGVPPPYGGAVPGPSAWLVRPFDF